MPTLTIRNLPEQFIVRLKDLARRHNRSMEQEAREILQAATADRLLSCQLIEKGWESLNHGISIEDIVQSIREDRDR